MSYVNIALLKGINDPTLKWDTIPIPFTTAVLTRDFVAENLAYVRGFRVINNDAGANLLYRYDTPNKQQITLPPASEDSQEGWTSFIQITPNAVSGTGILEVDLVPMEMAKIGG